MLPLLVNPFFDSAKPAPKLAGGRNSFGWSRFQLCVAIRAPNVKVLAASEGVESLPAFATFAALLGCVSQALAFGLSFSFRCEGKFSFADFHALIPFHEGREVASRGWARCRWPQHFDCVPAPSRHNLMAAIRAACTVGQRDRFYRRLYQHHAVTAAKNDCDVAAAFNLAVRPAPLTRFQCVEHFHKSPRCSQRGVINRNNLQGCLRLAVALRNS